jgi:hypothetical protein
VIFQHIILTVRYCVCGKNFDLVQMSSRFPPILGNYCQLLYKRIGFQPPPPLHQHGRTCNNIFILISTINVVIYIFCWNNWSLYMMMCWVGRRGGDLQPAQRGFLFLPDQLTVQPQVHMYSRHSINPARRIGNNEKQIFCSSS